MKLEQWNAERSRIIDRHEQEVKRLIREVDQLQRRVDDTLNLHKLELQQWDDGKPRSWKGFGLGV